MKLSRPLADIVASRRSCRTYRPVPLAAEDRKRIIDAIGALPGAPFGTTARFAVAAAASNDSENLKGLGTYGFIKNPAGFIIGAVRDATAPGVLEDYGFLMECLVLAATDLGMGTCWLGGSFTKSSFAARIAAAPGETVPAVVSLGYADDQRVMERLIRLGAGADHRLRPEELFFTGGFATPLPSGAAGPYDGVLDMVRRAPSASNRQPWRLVAEPEGHAWHFYCQRSPGYRKRNMSLFGVEDMQRIDMGIALCHFELACRESEIGGQWVIEAPSAVQSADGCWYVASWKKK